jgi:hypothetical protein
VDIQRDANKTIVTVTLEWCFMCGPYRAVISRTEAEHIGGIRQQATADEDTPD